MKLTLNLASRPYVNRRALYVAYAALAATMVLLLVANMVYAVRLRAAGEQARQRLAALGGQGTAVGDVVRVSPEALKQQQESVAFANDILRRDSFRWTRLLDNLEASAVEGIAIRALQPDHKDRSLQVKGAARGVDELRRYIDQLMASGHFSEVYLLEQSREKAEKGGSATKSEVPQPAGISFSIVLRGAF